MKILIIRADDRRSSETRDRLVAAGHIVTEARGGEQAARLLRSRPVNLVLVEGGHDALTLLEVAAGLRSENGRVSARYTPIFVLTDKPPQSPIWPSYIDGILSAPLDNEKLVAAYLEFLSASLSGVKRTTEMMPCCEVEAAIDRLGGDVELYKDLVDRFLDDTAGIRHRLQAAIDTQDGAKLHSAAHSLKGLAASVGAVRVAEALAELELLGRTGGFADVPAAWQQFRIEMERTADELAEYHRSSSVTPVLRPNGA